MSVTGWLGYARTVLGRALATTGRLTWSKLAFGAYMAVLVALFTGWYAADVGLPFSLALILAAVVSAALVTLALFFMGSLLAAPYALHAEQAAAADAAAEACAAETARLTAALAALDDTVQRRAWRDALGQFLLEGNALLPRILARTSGADDVQPWVERVVQHVRDTPIGIDAELPFERSGQCGRMAQALLH
jgi:hypothetical protein